MKEYEHIMVFRLNEEDYKAVERIAKEKHKKLSSVLREAVSFYLQHNGETYRKKKRTSQPMTGLISKKEFATLTKELEKRFKELQNTMEA